jgi:hypothetical protein
MRKGTTADGFDPAHLVEDVAEPVHVESFGVVDHISTPDIFYKWRAIVVRAKAVKVALAYTPCRWIDENKFLLYCV